MVREVDLTVDELVEAAIGYLESAGWTKVIIDNPEPDDGPNPVRSFARDLIQDSIDFAADFDVGRVLRMLFDREDETWSFE
jgi:hypothetical protein